MYCSKCLKRIYSFNPQNNLIILSLQRRKLSHRELNKQMKFAGSRGWSQLRQSGCKSVCLPSILYIFHSLFQKLVGKNLWLYEWLFFRSGWKSGTSLLKQSYGTVFSRHLSCFENRVYLLPQMCFSALSIWQKNLKTHRLQKENKRSDLILSLLDTLPPVSSAVKRDDKE